MGQYREKSTGRVVTIVPFRKGKRFKKIKPIPGNFILTGEKGKKSIITQAEFNQKLYEKV